MKRLSRLSRLFAFTVMFALAPAAPVLAELPKHPVYPGGARTALTAKKVCPTKWGKDARPVTAAMKKEVFAAYGLSGNTDPACIRDARGRHCEIDHLISRELGGADDVRDRKSTRLNSS